ncbi:MAG: hypothetical protein ACM3ZE_08720 [Myxococcales bacterium]
MIPHLSEIELLEPSRGIWHRRDLDMQDALEFRLIDGWFDGHAHPPVRRGGQRITIGERDLWGRRLKLLRPRLGEARPVDGS